MRSLLKLKTCTTTRLFEKWTQTTIKLGCVCKDILSSITVVLGINPQKRMPCQLIGCYVFMNQSGSNEPTKPNFGQGKIITKQGSNQLWAAL